MRLRVNAILSAGLSVALAGGCNKSISTEKEKELLGQLDKAVALATKLEVQRAEVIAEWMKRPKVEESRCDAKIHLNRQGEPSQYITPSKAGGFSNYLHAESVEALRKLEGTRLQSARGAAKDLRWIIGGKGREKIQKDRVGRVEKRIEKLISSSWYPYEIHYATRAVERTIEHRGKKYPGRVEGRVVVWDYVKGKVACAADAIGELKGGDAITVFFKAVYRNKGPKAKDYEDAYKNRLRESVTRRALAKIGLGG